MAAAAGWMPVLAANVAALAAVENDTVGMRGVGTERCQMQPNAFCERDIVMPARLLKDYCW